MTQNKFSDGVIPIFKPNGMTSHDVVARLRRILKIKRIGHTGTLDPDVTGVLPICIGKATRIAEQITDLPKSYQGQMTLGTSTTTEDASGEILEQTVVKKLTKEQVLEVLDTFVGEIEQVPPMYSSVKINGQRLYELARQGKIVERKPRKVHIYSLKMLNYVQSEHPLVDFEVGCSKGTYVRTLCVDLGKALGYPAHMSKLVRTKSGPFLIEQTVTLEQVEELVQQGNLEEFIVPMTDALPQFPQVILSEDIIEKKIFNGQKIELQISLSYEGLVKICDKEEKLVALYEKKVNELIGIPKKVFKDD